MKISILFVLSLPLFLRSKLGQLEEGELTVKEEQKRGLAVLSEEIETLRRDLATADIKYSDMVVSHEGTVGKLRSDPKLRYVFVGF